MAVLKKKGEEEEAFSYVDKVFHERFCLYMLFTLFAQVSSCAGSQSVNVPFVILKH